jgi:CRISPR-associated protein Cas5t
MKALLIKIYQPTAHYRMPFTYQRRHTYPIPPYSTVIGFLCNMLGIDYQGGTKYEQLKKCKLSVSGCFEQKLTEYIWFRNLSKGSHEKYFGSTESREKNGEINNIGGQSPMRIDVLENMHLNIHLAGNENFIQELEEYLHNPVNRLETVHLGRAEDWLVFESIQLVELKKSEKDKNYNHFFWIPQHIEIDETVDFDFNNAEGLFFNLPVFATIKDYDKTNNRYAERRFSYMRSKLNDGAITGMEYLYDEKSGIPVFFADLEKSK